MQGILEQNRIAASIIDRTRGSFGGKIGIVASVFGCWHKRLTRPFTENHDSYRACIDCGARKKFDTEDFRSVGPFYYPPIVRSEGSEGPSCLNTSQYFLECGFHKRHFFVHGFRRIRAEFFEPNPMQLQRAASTFAIRAVFGT